MKTDVLISFIVSYYNADSYIFRCIESILLSKSDKIELVLWDDGSENLIHNEISGRYSNDSRVKFYRNNVNEGPLWGRKRGFEKSNGRYVVFADADDYFTNSAVDTIIDIISKNNEDIIQFSSNVEDYSNDDETRKWLLKYLAPLNRSLYGKEIADEMFFHNSISTNLWGKIFTRKLLNKSFKCVTDECKNIYLGEDIFLSFFISLYAKKYVGIESTYLYVYCRGLGVSNSDEISLSKFKKYCEMSVFAKMIERSIITQAYNEFLYNVYISIYKRMITDCIRLYKERISKDIRVDAAYCLFECWGEDKSYVDLEREIGITKEMNSIEKKEIKFDVSVVIPVFNSEAYLNECLSTIMNQTLDLDKYEVIVVNDASDDNSLSIIDSYVSKYKNLKLINIDKSGAAAARNVGLKESRGKYVIFLDSDDFFELDMLSELLTVAEENDAQIILFDADKYNTKDNQYQKTNLLNFRIENNVYSAESISEKLYQITSPVPWTKFYRRSFLLSNKILYQNLENSNDLYFSWVSLALAKRIVIKNKIYTHYRINVNGSVQNTKVNNPVCFLQACEAVYEYISPMPIYEKIRESFLINMIDQIGWNVNGMPPEGRNKIFSYLIDDCRYNKFVFSKEFEILCSKSSYKSLIYQINQFRYVYVCEKKIKYEVVYNNIISEPKISVVIPCFNVEKYIECTINSVLNQGFKDVEIICIDDGSSDGTMSILYEYAQKDSRILLASGNNYGLGAARNFGIELAKGEYIYFLDADDYLENNALSILYKEISEKHEDVLYFDAHTFLDDGINDTSLLSKFNYIRIGDYQDVFMGIDLFERFRLNGEFYQSACLQLVSLSYLRENHIVFPEGILHEDNVYSLQVIINAKRAGYINRQLYYRRMRQDSIMTNSVSYRNCFGYFMSYVLLEQFYNSVFEKLNLNQREIIETYIARMIQNSIDAYLKMPYEMRGFEKGIIRHYQIFCKVILDEANKDIQIYRLNNEIKRLKSENIHKTDAIKPNVESHSIDYQQLISEYIDANKKVNQLSYELAVTRMSMSCRIGRAITFVPRLFVSISKKFK